MMTTHNPKTLLERALTSNSGLPMDEIEMKPNGLDWEAKLVEFKACTESDSKYKKDS